MIQLIISLENIIEIKNERLNYKDLYFVFKFNQSIIIYFREKEKEDDIKIDEIFSI